MKAIILLVALLLPFQYVPARARSQEAKATFKYFNPCPSTGNHQGACPGYVIDHIIALACGGADDPSNMQWQSVYDGKAKDHWERQGCSIRRRSYASSYASNGAYYTGKKGGCYTYSSRGKKRYVDHGYCQ